MNPVGRFVDLVVDNSKVAILLMLAVTVAIGVGAGQVSQQSQLDQFETESTAREKLEYIQANFETGAANVTRANIVVRNGNVLSKESLLAMLEFERALRANETIEGTLAPETPIAGIPNVIATTAIARERARELQARAAELKRRRAALQANRTALQERRRALNATADALRAALTDLRANPDANVRAAFEDVDANTPVDLGDEDFATFQQAATALRTPDDETSVEEAYRLGTRGVLRDEYAALQERGAELQRRARELQETARELEEMRAELEGLSPSLEKQIAQIESMNASAIDRAIRAVFAGEGIQRVLAFMPTDYQPGSTRAGATMLIVRQTLEETTTVQGAVSERIVDSQLAMREIAQARSDGLSYMVFGAGIVTHELDASMTDSLLIVGPLALLFVLLTLIVAYRDLLDIVLGLFGIAIVLVWTFGFMGWADIAFSQIFVAVPVLLIGLSIDYAIHVFMRHREHRDEGDPTRGSMRTALAGVGLALVWVTATTVIGFLSNLVSPVPPIQDFGVVSAFGIVAAFFVFTVLVPAIKVELDELLEGWGFDRNRRAFGTGGGRFSRVLGVGATLARKAPYAVILLTLLVTAVGAYGGSQVDTSFQQEDFLADDPPRWMQQLPEPFQPSEYTVRDNLKFVNQHFVRQDSQAQILVQGQVTGDGVLERLAEAAKLAASKRVTQTFATGEPAIDGPLRTMRRVAATNASFNETFRSADGPDANTIPDRNVEQVYDALFRVAPEQARNVIHRTAGGEYRALRLVISVKGGAAGSALTRQMRDVADSLDGRGLRATATGQPIVNEIVQDELFDGVIESLAITLVAIFLFLAAAYWLAEGSATLGIVTLLPVAFVVAWILGTMYMLGIPFNVLTGTITSLTVGLGVAYGIHVSERYTLELERQDSVWDAMHTAVTGTGGALLGSAATTVGGFGVLGFAILPPLQQFGIITGITIVYAFLASVLVLPSLLVVWTRLADPEAAEGGFGDESGGGPIATRDIPFEHVRPGQDLPVTVEVEDVDGRVVIEEAVDGAIPLVAAADPEPVDARARGGEVFATWDLDGDPAKLTYHVSIPEEAADDDVVSIEGEVRSTDEIRAVGGDASVTVVSDLFERVLARGEVTEDDLRLAGEQFGEGTLTRRQYERITREWLSGAGESGENTDGSGGG